jgi:hypothetical protein
LLGPGLAAAVLLAGCIERKERITVRPNGDIQFQVNYQSESWSEMYMGDAWPRLEGGWLAVMRSEVKDDGAEEFFLEAEATVPWGAELPSHYEIEKDPFPGTATRFPTTLIIEERRDGTYYHFKRTYAARDWAYVGKVREEIEERIKDLENAEQAAAEEGVDLAPPTPEQQRERQLLVLKALTDFETVKLEHFTLRALRDAVPDAPQDVCLAARTALRAQAGAIDFDRIAALLAEPDDEAREAALDAEAKGFEQRARQAVEIALRESGWVSESRLRDFFNRLEWHREYFEITDELADDQFKITVVMPGQIVAHNADHASGGEAFWEITGDAFRDREVELMVTSRVR